jgi:Amt family ammonium transporter
VFQVGFIATATTLISGAVAERMRFGGYIVLATFVAGVTYPVFGHWAWGAASLAETGARSDGWLKRLGFVDFAGSTVVHSVGGWVALAAIIILGPRIGRFGSDAVPIRGHDLPLTTVGVFVLWIGWYGFNGGSTLALSSAVPSILLNTTLAATFGGLVGMALTWRFDRRPDVVTIMNGSLAGLVGITASANIMSPWRSPLIGAVAAVVMHLVTLLLERLQIDDAVGAVPVHLGAGVWGTLAVALLGDVGSFPVASSRFEQAWIQLVGIAVCCAWAFGVGFVVLWLVDRRVPFRIDRDEIERFQVRRYDSKEMEFMSPPAPHPADISSARVRRADHTGRGAMAIRTDEEITRSLGRVEQQLCAGFPDVSSEVVHREVAQVAQVLLDVARFTNFVPLLTYRYARERVRNRERAELPEAA